MAVSTDKAICNAVKSPIHQSGEAKCTGGSAMEVDGSILDLRVSQILHKDLVHGEMGSNIGIGTDGERGGGSTVLVLQAPAPVDNIHGGGVLLPLHLHQDHGDLHHAKGALAPALKAPRAP